MTVTATGRHLLLIDDDPRLANLLEEYAALFGFVLRWADRPSTGLEMLSLAPDLILLDVQLPEKDGFAFCQEVRGRGVQTPIIMLTARGDDIDRIKGLRLGADDYVAKPFNPDELFARVDAVLRRPPAVRVQNDALDADRLLLRLSGREIALTAAETRLLELLTAAPGKACSRESLIQELDEEAERFDRTIDTRVSRLRAKLEVDPQNPRHLLTVRGVGYRFEW